jgi:hypothetical protein
VNADLHAEHRPYLAALADGELELVPAATRAHVAACVECGSELEAHRLLSSRLRAAARASAPLQLVPSAPRGRRLLLPLAAAAALVLVVGGVAFATRPQVPAPVTAAVLVAARQPQYLSTDPVEIASWCSAQYGNRVPVVAFSDLTPQGARMDWPSGDGVATVTYSLNGRTVHVSWLSVPEGSAQPEVLTVGGRPAVLVREHGLSVLVSGSAPSDQLVRVAREVESSL